MSELNIPDGTRVVNIGAGAFLVDRGTFDGEPAVFLEPTPDDGVVDRVGMNGPKDWPLNTLVPDSIVFTITNQFGADVLASKFLGYDAALTIATLEAQLAHARAEEMVKEAAISKAENGWLKADELLKAARAEIEKLKQEAADDKLAFNHANETLGKYEDDLVNARAEIERRKAPVSDEEWNPYAWFDDGDDDTVGNMTRPQVDYLIAARAAAQKPEDAQ